MKQSINNKIIVLLALIGLLISGCGANTEAPSELDSPDGQISISMLNVEQGLSILVNCNDHYLLYDGGDRKTSSFVVSYLQSHINSEGLEYMIASHYDADHISGLVGVMNTIVVENALIPNCTADTNIYNSFITTLNGLDTKVVYPVMGDTFMLDAASVQVLNPASYEGDNENDNSIAIRIVYKDFSCIITGDAGKDAEGDMIASNAELESDIYVVGHHGSAYSSSEAFLDTIKPAYAFISVGSDNKYGHPTDIVLQRLQDREVKLFRTDKQGTVTCYSDGTDIWFDMEPCDDWSTGEPPSVSIDGEQRVYVLNTHTMKVHMPDCSNINSINEDNKKEVTSTLEALLASGYSPCKNCNP